MNRLTKGWLNKNGVSEEVFLGAVAKACDLVEDEKDPGERILLTAAVVAQPGLTHCDYGGGVGLYNIILALLGMEITVVDSFHQVDDPNPVLRKMYEDRLELFKELGIKWKSADILSDFTDGQTKYQSASCFETIEHLPHSPKPFLDQVMDELETGGRFALSVPNVARIEQRFRVFFGRTPHEKYPNFYETGTPFWGHHREMTEAEILWLSKRLNLAESTVFGTDITYKPLPGIGKKKRSGAKKFMSNLNYDVGITDFIVPRRMRKHLWLVGRYQGHSG